MSERRRSEERLRELLARTRERLTKTSVDAESRKHLSAVVRDIDHDLGRDGAPQGTGTAGKHAPRLEALAARFEGGHPALAETIREVIDALVKAGI